MSMMSDWKTQQVPSLHMPRYLHKIKHEKNCFKAVKVCFTMSDLKLRIVRKPKTEDFLE